MGANHAEPEAQDPAISMPLSAAKATGKAVGVSAKATVPVTKVTAKYAYRGAKLMGKATVEGVKLLDRKINQERECPEFDEYE